MSKSACDGWVRLAADGPESGLRLLAKAVVTALAVMPPAIGFAQEDPSGATGGGKRATALEEIIVTAQKRSQNVQDVPVAISAYSSDTLERVGISRVAEVGQLDPSIKISTGGGVIVPFLRGVGNPSGTTVGNEASVPVYIDDMYYTRLDHIYLELNSIERVEVLKGPQGTLFGRNASGGLVQVFTRDPMDGEALDASIGYGNYNTVSGKFYGATPLGENAAVDFALSATNQSDGWGTVLATGEDTGRVKFVAARSKLVWEPTDTTRIRVVGFYGDITSSQYLYHTIFRGTTNAAPPYYGPVEPLSPPNNFYDGVGTTEFDLTHEGWGGSLKIDQELGFADFSSITAYRESDESYLADGEMTFRNWLLYELNAEEIQASQEFQLKSNDSSNFDWILGTFYLYSEAGFTPTRVTGDAINLAGGVPGSALMLKGLQTIDSYSAYGQTTFPLLSDNTSLTLGLRYTSDDVQGVGTQTIAIPSVGSFPAGASYDDTVTFEKVTYRAAIDHQFSDDTLGYVSYSRGYKSGVFNTLPLAAPPSDPEVVDAFEVGVKTDLLDNRVRLNAAMFVNDIQSPQVQTIIVNGDTAFIGFTNAESAEVKGLEFSLEALVTDSLRFTVGGAYLDAKYKSFVTAPFLFPPTDLPQNGGTCPGLTAGDPDVPANEGGNCPIVQRDASGNRMAQVPEWRFNAGMSYDLYTESGDFTFDLSMSYTGSFNWQPDNILEEDAYTLFTGSIGYNPRSNENLSFKLWGKNLTGEEYHSGELAVAGSGGNLAQAGAPRTYGAEVRYQY